MLSPFITLSIRIATVLKLKGRVNSKVKFLGNVKYITVRINPTHTEVHHKQEIALAIMFVP
jgi:hypothetical protein